MAAQRQSCSPATPKAMRLSRPLGRTAFRRLDEAFEIEAGVSQSLCGQIQDSSGMQGKSGGRKVSFQDEQPAATGGQHANLSTVSSQSEAGSHDQAQYCKLCQCAVRNIYACH